MNYYMQCVLVALGGNAIVANAFFAAVECASAVARYWNKRLEYYTPPAPLNDWELV